MNIMTRKKIRTTRNNYARYIGLLKKNLARCHRHGHVSAAKNYQTALILAKKELQSFEFFLERAHLFYVKSTGVI